MRHLRPLAGFAVACAFAACGAPLTESDGAADAAVTADAHADAEPLIDSPAADAVDGAPDVTADVAAEVATDVPDASGPVTAAQLLALTTACMRIPGTPLYATDSGLAQTIPLCQLNGAIFWQADMDIDCDGGSSALCRSDPYYSPDTSAQTSTGLPLDASTLPFVVIPLPRTGFGYAMNGIRLGSVVAVIYRGQLVFGVFGDEGPSTVIGEASNALATALGINGNPSTGGVDSGVTYIIFTGATGAVTRNEDHAEAVRIGEMRASQLVYGP
ncbi:MAG: glycoside hydrolase family 75 protein [Deltaproteobacteria bacterium]